MIQRASYDLLRVGLRIAVQLWPLWLFWFAWSLSSNMWLGYLQTFPNRSDAGYAIAYRAWPSVALVGPILLMFAAILAYRMQLATRVMPIAGIGGVIVATALTGWPEYQRLASYVGRASPIDILGALDLGNEFWGCVKIDLYSYEALIDELGSLGVVVGIAIHQVAPRTPHCTDIQKDRSIKFLRALKGVATPRIPVDRLPARAF